MKDSNELVELFYSRDVPCNDQCVRLDQLSKSVQEQNLDFETLLRVSNNLASFKVPVEMLYEKLMRIDQKLHNKNLINVGSGVIPESDDEDGDE